MTEPDDPSIGDALTLLRWIPPSFVVSDSNREEGFRPSSAAFRDYELSVFLTDVLAGRGETVRDVTPEGKFMAAFTAGFARARQQGVVRSPEKGHPAHGDVVGEKTKPRRFPPSKEFAEKAEWAVPPSPDFKPPADKQ